MNRIFKKYEGNPVMSPDKMPDNVLYTFKRVLIPFFYNLDK